ENVGIEHAPVDYVDLLSTLLERLCERKDRVRENDVRAVTRKLRQVLIEHAQVEHSHDDTRRNRQFSPGERVQCDRRKQDRKGPPRLSLAKSWGLSEKASIPRSRGSRRGLFR